MKVYDVDQTLFKKSWDGSNNRNTKKVCRYLHSRLKVSSHNVIDTHFHCSIKVVVLSILLELDFCEAHEKLNM